MTNRFKLKVGKNALGWYVARPKCNYVYDVVEGFTTWHAAMEYAGYVLAASLAQT